MKVSEILESVRARWDVETAQVLADALLEAGDPRGMLIAATAAGKRRSALAACVERVRDRIPDAETLQLQYGLVARIRVPAEAIPRIGEEWFSDEPLARVAFAMPEQAELIDSCASVLRSARGVEVDGVSEESWPHVKRLLAEARPLVLVLDLRYLAELGETDRWPWVRALSLRGRSSEQISTLLPQVPDLTHLAADADADAWLPDALRIASLERLDLRRQALSDDGLKALERRRSKCEVIHPALGIAPADETDDPLGHSGLHWQRAGAPTRRAVAVGGSGISFAHGRDRELRFHRDDRPTWKTETPVTITALDASDDLVVVGADDGSVRGLSLADGEEVEGLRFDLGRPIRQISARWSRASAERAPSGLDLAVRQDGGFWIRRAGEEQHGDEELTGLVWHGDGMARARGSTVELTGRSERVVELRDPVSMLASDGLEDLVAVAGTLVYRIAPAGLVVLGERAIDAPLVLDVQDGIAAWAISDTALAIHRGDRTTDAYYSSYSNADQPLRIGATAVAADGAVIAAFEHGGLNLLLGDGQALKADPFPGDRPLRWVFLYDGQILVAD